jgi:hypothetical protein
MNTNFVIDAKNVRRMIKMTAKNRYWVLAERLYAACLGLFRKH